MATEQRLIDANSLETRMGGLCDEFGTDHLFIDAIVYEIGNAPTVDAVEVVHAEWLDGSGMSRDGSIAYESIDCSHCEEVFKIETHDREYWKTRFKACPFCGALMDGGNEDV